jgi:hypothetical protein
MPATVPFFVSTDDSCMSSQDSTRKAFSYGDVQEWSEQWHAHNCNTPILKKKLQHANVLGLTQPTKSPTKNSRFRKFY